MYQKDFFKEVGGFPKSDLGDEFVLMTNSLVSSDRLGHCNYVLVSARVDSESGLSSAENKIVSEDNLILFKEKYFNLLRQKDIRYIKMRHHLVKSLNYARLNKFSKSFENAVKAVWYNPFGAIRLIVGHNK